MAVDAGTLVVSVQGLENLGQVVGTHVKNFADATDEMFKIIDVTMDDPNHWSGAPYDTFKEKCDHFRTNQIEKLQANLQAFSDHFNFTSSEGSSSIATMVGHVQENTNNNLNGRN